MELSNSAKEIVVQAQMLMLSTGGSGLCVEHLFYGILLLADYLDPPMNKPEFREDGEKVFRDLESEIIGEVSVRGGQIIATGEGYAKLDGCMKGIASVQKNAKDGKIAEK